MAFSTACRQPFSESRILDLSRERIRNLLRDITAPLRRKDLAGTVPIADEAPLRAELFSAEQMEQHGKELAGTHRLSHKRLPDGLLARLTENQIVLLQACALLGEKVRAGRRITPAGEWLLDNFYLIEEQIRIARRHLPRAFLVVRAGPVRNRSYSVKPCALRKPGRTGAAALNTERQVMLPSIL